MILTKINLLLILFVLFTSTIRSQGNNDRKMKKETKEMNLIETEIAFAEAVKNTSVRDGFLQFIDETGVLFRPHPVDGKKFLMNSEARPGKLLWYPSVSFISNAGDMGANLGPWEFRRSMEEEPVAFGNFATVWGKQNNGNWKFLIDMGNGNDKPEIDIPRISSSKVVGANELQKDFGDKALFELEKEFINKNIESGFAQSYNAFVGTETIILRDNSFPIVGDNIKEFLQGQSHLQKWKPLGGALSVSKDFGYTYGSISKIENLSSINKAEQSMYYMHVWYYNDGWKLLIDVASDIPEPQQ